MLLDEISEVPQVTFNTLQTVLPVTPPDFDLNHFYRQVASKLLTETRHSSRWRNVPRRAKDKDTTLDLVSEIFNGIKEIVNVGSSMTFTVAPERTPFEERTIKSRPNAYLGATSNDIAGWSDIIMPIELEDQAPEQYEANDVVARVVWSMHTIMRKDPCRRFVYGLTIRMTNARLWFSDRSGVVVSSAIDINKQWKPFARIFLSLIQATREQLGYDTDMHPVPSPSDTPQYDITVRTRDKGSNVYRTVEVLSDIATDYLLGHGTRVWKVQKLIDGTPQGPLYALKDTWISPDRVPEHETMEDIKSRHPDYAQYFLTVLDAGFVPANADDPLTSDDTVQTIRRERKLAKFGKPLSTRPHWDPFSAHTAPVDRKTQVGKQSATPSIKRPKVNWLEERARRHYRIVFKEVGTPVHRLRNFTEVITAVQGGARGLRAIHMTNRVHRDVSSGNILLVRDGPDVPPRGVIMDFEYVKDFATASSPKEPMKGTDRFMAIEVTQELYFHRETPDRKLYELEPDTSPRFQQNALHDLESIWWICTFMVFYLVHPEERRTRRQHTRFHGLFETCDERCMFWTHAYFYHVRTEHFSKVSDLVEIMWRWGTELREIYYKAYKDGNYYSIGEENLGSAYDLLERELENLRRAVAEYPLAMIPLRDLAPLSWTPPSPSTQIHNRNDLVASEVF